MVFTLNFPRAIFFDLDETLIKNTLSGEQLFGEIFRATLPGVEESRFATFMDVLFGHASGIWSQMFEREESPSQQLTAAMASAIQAVGGDRAAAGAFYGGFVAAAARYSELNPNAMETIFALRERGIAVGIITNGFEDVQLAKVRHHGLDRAVDRVVVSEHARAHKPDSRVFVFALESINVPASRAWHVGDHTINDVAGAVNSGLTAILYSQEKQEEREMLFAGLEVKPHHTIADLREVLELLP